MNKQIFVNLPVRDVQKARDFQVALGNTINPKFSNDDAACVVVSDSIYLMLLRQDYFQTFTDKLICDASTHIQVLLAMPEESREQVDVKIDKAISAGGQEVGAARDYGFMYQRSYADPDGHVFEAFYMNEAEFPGA